MRVRPERSGVVTVIALSQQLSRRTESLLGWLPNTGIECAGTLNAFRGLRMLRYYYINKEWIVSPTARRIYQIAACLSLALFFMLVIVRVTGAIPEALVPLVKPLLFAGVLGTATTIIAMEYFLFGFDKSSGMKKVFWFGVMLFPPLGPALYCFIVYSRSEVLKADSAKRVDAASA
jgi:hypothetical protein